MSFHDHAADLEELARLASQPDELDQVLVRALDALGDLVPYDLAAVLSLEGDELAVRAARGRLASEEVREHRLSLRSFPTVRRALETRRPLALTEDHHASDEGDPYDGVLDLPDGHSCMVVPLFAGDRSLGVITLDRAYCEPYAALHVQVAGVVGQIVSLAIAYAEQAALLRRARAQLQARQELLEQEAWGGPAAEKLRDTRAPAMLHALRQARQVAVTDTPVLVQGETGTGKEVVARAIHGWSPRREGPFVTLNCAAIPENLVESELFGHVEGAFTGAVAGRAGRFLAANGGTLLLDEVAELPLAVQARLLRVLQEGTFSPVGSDDVLRVDVRVLAATHVDLQAAVEAGRFREDLYYRLAVFPLYLPALRDRRDDVLPLARSILDELSARSGRGPWRLAEDAGDALLARRWPGNVRELRNVLERAVILCEGEVVPARLVADVDRAPVGAPASAAAPVLTLAEAERLHVEATLRRTEGRIYGREGAAALLGLKPTTLQSRMKKLGIDRRAFSA